MRIILQQFAGLCCRWRHIAAVKPGKILFIETAGLTRVVSVPPFFLSKFGNHRAWRGRVGADIGDWCGDEGNLAGIHRQVWGIRNAAGGLTLAGTSHSGRTGNKTSSSHFRIRQLCQVLSWCWGQLVLFSDHYWASGAALRAASECITIL